MAKRAAEILVETLLDWGVTTIFGIPGDGINGIMEALRQRQEQIRFIQVRHEESAALMACAYAKFTGKLGCCIATSGPGGIHLLNGLYDAKLDGQPVLAITGLQFHDLIGTHTQQDVPLDRLFDPVCVFNERVMSAAHVQNLASLACRTALANHGVAHLTIPVDVQDQTLNQDERSMRNVPNHVSEVKTTSRPTPPIPDLDDAAEILNAGKKIAILAGRGALGAGNQLEQLAETLAAPIIKALLGKAAVPDDSPYTTGGIGLLGTLPSEEAMTDCDTLLIAGSSFPYIEFYPKPGKARCIQIDSDAARIGLRYPADVGLVGDCTATLDALLPLLTKKTSRTFLERAQKGYQEWLDLMEERGSATVSPMKPQVVAHELGKQLPANAIVASDSGTNTTWWARHIHVKRGQMHSCSGNLATMACGLPYAIAAQIAYPERLVVAFVGDGGFTMLMGELATCVKYRLPVKIFIVKNNSLGQIKWEQLVFLGNPEYGCELQPIDFAMVARAFGVAGYTIEAAQNCAEIVGRALAVDGPVVVEVLVDPNEPPMPASVTAKQAVHFAESLAKGTKDWEKIASTVAKNRIRELI